MTYEELVERCKEMRARAERAEAEFLVFLMDAEANHADVWRAAGIDTFAQYLSSLTLCKVDRYEAFVRGVERIGKDAALQLGAHLTIEQSRVRKPETIAAMTERAECFVEKNRVAPSEETVKAWRRELDGPNPDKKHGTVRYVDELHRLRAENARLKAELKAAHRRIAELEKKTGKKKAA